MTPTMPRAAAALLSALLVLGSLAPAAAGPRHLTKRPTKGSVAARDHVPREVIVRYRRDLAPASRFGVRSLVDSPPIEKLPLPDTQVLRTPAGSTVAEVVRELEQRPEVVYAEPNYLYQAAAVPNDPLYPQMWALGASSNDADLDAPEAWDLTKGSNDVTVAVVDSGVAFDHPDLADNIWVNRGEAGPLAHNGRDDDGNGYVDDVRGWDFIEDDAMPYDLHGHGTHVAGTIGASGNNRTGITGINWRVSIMALGVLEVDGFGTSSDVAAAFVYARRNGARVVNASLGGPDYSRSIAAAIAGSPDVLFVAAAGNEAKNIDLQADYPCSFSYENVVCVGSSTDRDALSNFSNYGASTVDLAAPGSSILSAMPHFEDVFEEGFETDISDRWISGGTNDSWGQNTDQYGGYVTYSPNTEYLNGTDAWLQTRAPIDLTGTNGCLLTFALNMQTQRGSDGLLIEASRDANRWEELGAYSGDTGEWGSVLLGLGEFYGSPIYLRLRLVTDSQITSDGVAIDDLAVQCITPAFTNRDYVYYSGTSMAAPHVAGAIALLLSVAPDASASEIKDALLDGADRPSGVIGRVDSGRLNLNGALRELDQDLPIPDPEVTDLPVDIDPSTSPTPDSTPTPTPSASETPTPAPSGSPTGTVHERTAGFSLRKHLVATGSLRSDGPIECIAAARVKILRNGKVVKRVLTNSAGAFRVRMPDRRGTYRLVAPRRGLPSGDSCSKAVSQKRTHRHTRR